MRTVLDTDVLVAALRSDRGASRLLVEGALAGDFPLLLSVPLILEYEAVLTRPEHLTTAGVTHEEIGIFLDALALVGEQVRLSFRWRPLLTDPQDDMVLETAVNGGAALLVTFNRRDFARGAEQFELKVIAPGEALELLELL